MKLSTKIFLLLQLSFFLMPMARAINLFDERVYHSLIADRKAYLPGDLLTVIIMEASDAHSSADLASGKDIKTALKASYNKNRYDLGLGLNGQGKAAAKTGRQGKIKAALTVKIKTVFPDGSYLVEGRQLITINNEQQAIQLKGLVRREDISAENTILSTRIADAQITYSGNGTVSNAQKHNYIYQVLSFIGLV